jgi:hypothetical protein
VPNEDMVWAVRIADQEFQIRDLPVGVLATIAKNREQTWLLTQAAPLLNLFVAQDVLEAVCAHLGVPAPDGLTGRNITDYFVQVEDDLPEQFEDGVPLKAAAP